MYVPCIVNRSIAKNIEKFVVNVDRIDSDMDCLALTENENESYTPRNVYSINTNK